MDNSTKFYDLVTFIKDKYPRFKIVKKETSPVFKLLYTILFMKYWHPHFLDSYATTIFDTVYMPSHIIGDDVGYVVLRHELIHIEDSHRYPFFFQFSYLLLLPFIFSFRAIWEYRAYCENLKVESEMFGSVRMEAINYYSDLFCDNSYLWMFPFKKFVVDRFLFFCYKNKLEVI